MTRDQIKAYRVLWRDACQEQGWTGTKEELDARRMEIHRRLFGSAKSSTELTNAEMDRVRAAFKALANGIQGVHELDHAEDGRRRRWVWVIERELIPCLGVYVEHAEGYLADVLRERFRVFAGVSHWKDLPHGPVWREDEGSGRLVRWPNALEMFLQTLAGRVDALRRKAGDSGHEMRIKAGVQCACSVCAKGRRAGVLRGAAERRSGAEVVQTVANPGV